MEYNIIGLVSFGGKTHIYDIMSDGTKTLCNRKAWISMGMYYDDVHNLCHQYKKKYNH